MKKYGIALILAVSFCGFFNSANARVRNFEARGDSFQQLFGKDSIEFVVDDTRGILTFEEQKLDKHGSYNFVSYISNVILALSSDSNVLVLVDFNNMELRFGERQEVPSYLMLGKYRLANFTEKK